MRREDWPTNIYVLSPCCNNLVEFAHDEKATVMFCPSCRKTLGFAYDHARKAQEAAHDSN